MREVPDCLHRRYRALDDLIRELNSVPNIDVDDDISSSSTNDPGIKMMCDFWSILKEDPECNLKQAVQQRMCMTPHSGMFRPQRVSCYMAAHNCMKKDEEPKRPDPGKLKNVCCHKDPEPNPKCCSSKSATPSGGESNVLPLSKVLCNLKEAASFDRKCQGMVNELMSTQKQLQDQIQHLEHREKEGMQLLKQADCMWACMEDAYKKKIQESQERQKELLKQLKEAEASTNKWRKNKKDLEFQLINIATCQREITEKINQKQNDIKCMNVDIADYKKRMENNKKELEAAKKSLGTKKQTSDDKIRRIAADVIRKEKAIKEEHRLKDEKEREGNQYIREAREDLQKLNRVLLQKKIENEDMKAEKEALIDELELLAETYDQCKDKCQTKKKSIEEELKIIDKEIANYKVKCIRCHQCTDTIDIRKFCTDCPKCLEERDCLYKDDHCNPDHTMDCVCMGVKQRFLDNVFENMYTVLERQVKTGPGKAVAEAVLTCLKSSRNGKLDQQTRQILQDFILTTVKKNLNLTIVGGAVKTRCELDSDTYKQLMLCLKQVKAARPPKADKETAAKKEPCPRWGIASECNCPKGPKACICTKRAPPPPQEPGPCPPPDKEDLGETRTCPVKESTACGPDCAMHAVPSAVGTDVAAWRPDPCQAPTCQFKNMRAAQCVLGPEALTPLPGSRSYVTAVPYSPNMRILEEKDYCKCKPTTTKTCSCEKDGRHHPRERIIEEVMGKYFEVTPIEKVGSAYGNGVNGIQDKQNLNEICVCLNIPMKKCMKSEIPQKTSFLLSPDFYDNDMYDNNMYIIDDDEITINQKCVINSDSDDMIEISSGLSLKYFDGMEYNEDLEKTVKSCLTTTIHTDPNDTSITVTGNSYAVNDMDFNIIRTDEKSYKDISDTIFQREVCNVAQELIKDVIVFDDIPNVNSSQEWITTDTFISEILSKTTKHNVSVSSIAKNEMEIKMEWLEDDEEKSDYKCMNNVSDPIDIDNLYRNIYYSHNSSNNNLTHISINDSHYMKKEIDKFKHIRQSLRNTKQMKVETRTPCNKETCRMLFKSINDDTSRQHYQESPFDSSRGKQQHVEDNIIDILEEKVSSTILDKTTSDQYSDEVKGNVDLTIKDDLIKEQYRPILQSQKGFDTEYTEPIDIDPELPNNHPEPDNILEHPELEIDEKVMDLIKSITKEDTVFVSLKKTKSGHLTLGLNSFSNDKNGESILIRRSPSSNMIMEVDKKKMQILKANEDKRNSENHLEVKTKESMDSLRVPGICTPQCIKNKSLTQNAVKKMLRSNSKKDFRVCSKKHQHEITSVDHLQKLYDKNQRKFKVRTKYNDEEFMNGQGILTPTPSGNIIIIIKNSVDTQKTEYDCAEIPVSVFITRSSTMEIVFKDSVTAPYWILKQTTSGRNLVHAKQRNLEKLEVEQNRSKTGELIKFKIKGINNEITEPSAVIKVTASGNYEVVLDREFEKIYTQTIKDKIGSDNESYFELTQTKSGVVFDFDKNGSNKYNSKRALLLKSVSGILKIVVSDKLVNQKETTEKLKLLQSESFISTKEIGNFLRELPSPTSNLKLDIPNKKRPNSTKSISDSNIQGTATAKLQSTQNILDKPSTTLKRTVSGQYAVVLDKESKKSFINNIITYIDKTSKGVIPIKRTDSGELTIELKTADRKEEYASLKITSSGNIYVILDENSVNNISNNVAINTKSGSNKISTSPYISKVENPENKAISTSCNANPKNSSCDVSKCVCKDLYTREEPFSHSDSLKTPQATGKICNKPKCSRAGCDKQSIKSNNKSPHIVIKPCNSRPVPDKGDKFQESYYCAVQSICPYHKGRYEAVSNELLEISGLCNKAQEKKPVSKVKTHAKIRPVKPKKVTKSRVKSNWDSFDYLPPQLPPFLRDVSYR